MDQTSTKPDNKEAIALAEQYLKSISIALENELPEIDRVISLITMIRIIYKEATEIDRGIITKIVIVPAYKLLKTYMVKQYDDNFKIAEGVFLLNDLSIIYDDNSHVYRFSESIKYLDIIKGCGDQFDLFAYRDEILTKITTAVDSLKSLYYEDYFNVTSESIKQYQTIRIKGNELILWARANMPHITAGLSADFITFFEAEYQPVNKVLSENLKQIDSYLISSENKTIIIIQQSETIRTMLSAISDEEMKRKCYATLEIYVNTICKKVSDAEEYDSQAYIANYYCVICNLLPVVIDSKADKSDLDYFRWNYELFKIDTSCQLIYRNTDIFICNNNEDATSVRFVAAINILKAIYDSGFFESIIELNKHYVVLRTKGHDLIVWARHNVPHLLAELDSEFISFFEAEYSPIFAELLAMLQKLASSLKSEDDRKDTIANLTNTIRQRVNDISGTVHSAGYNNMLKIFIKTHIGKLRAKNWHVGLPPLNFLRGIYHMLSIAVDYNIGNNAYEKMLNACDLCKIVDKYGAMLGLSMQSVRVDVLSKAVNFVDQFINWHDSDKMQSQELAYIYSLCGDIYRAYCKLFIQGNFTNKDKFDLYNTAGKAIIYLEKSIKFSGFRLDNPNIESEKVFAYTRIAESYSFQGNMHRAIIYWEKALDNEAIGNETRWECYQNLGRTYVALATSPSRNEKDRLESLRSSIDSYLNSFKVWEPRLDPTSSKCSNINNLIAHLRLGYCYYLSHDYGNAFNQANFVIEWKFRDNDSEQRSFHYGQAYYYAGLALINMKKYASAAVHFESAEHFTTNRNQKKKCWLVLSILYIKLVAGGYDTVKIAYWKSQLKRVRSNLLSCMSKKQYDSWYDLNEEEKNILIDPLASKDYVLKCKAQIKNNNSSIVLSNINKLLKVYYDIEGKYDKVLLSVKARAQVKLRQYNDALDTLSYALRANFDSKNQSMIYSEIGNIYLIMNDAENAAEYFLKSYAIEEHRVPLYKAAKSLSRSGNHARSIELYEMFLVSGQDKSPLQTRSDLARTYWNKFKVDGEIEGLGLALSYAKEVAGCSDIDDSIAKDKCIGLLVDMSEHLGSGTMHLAGVAKSKDPVLVRALVMAATDRNYFHRDMVQLILIELSADSFSTTDLYRNLIKYLCRAVIHAYFGGATGDPTLEQLLHEILHWAFTLPDEHKRIFLFELLSGERDAILSNMAELYSRLAEDVFKPLMASPNEFHKYWRKKSGMAMVKDFLLTRLPPNVIPHEYKGSGHIDCELAIEQIKRAFEEGSSMSGAKVKLVELHYDDFTGCMFSLIDFININDIVKTLIANKDLNNVYGTVSSKPIYLLCRLHNETESIHVELHYQNLSDPCTRKILKKNIGKFLKSKPYINNIKWKDWNRLGMLSFSLKYQFAIDGKPFLVETFKPFIDHLLEYSQRFFLERKPNAAFYHSGEETFNDCWNRASEASCLTEGEWEILYRFALDMQFSVNAEWLFMPPQSSKGKDRHPRRVVHNLYNWILLRKEPDVNAIQEAIASLLDIMWLFIRKELIPYNASEIDLYALISALAKDISTKSINVKGQKGIYVSGIYRMYEILFKDLIHNAIKYSPREGDPGKEAVVTITIDSLLTSEKDTDALAEIQIENINSKERLSESGTGIGLVSAKHLTEEILQGQLIVPTQDANPFIVKVLLPMSVLV